MRRQLLTSTLAAAAAVVLLLGIPLGFAAEALLREQALDSLQGEAVSVASLLNEPQLLAVDQIVILREFAAEDRRLRLILLGSEAAADTGPPPALPEGLDADVRAARFGQVGRIDGGGVLAVSVPVRGGVFQVLRLVRADDALIAATRQSWAAIGGLAVFAIAIAIGLARRQGERLAAPMEALAAAARRLGDGDFTARAPYSGLPEADDVAGALQATAERLGGMLERSRSFSADASHQLRTPLTALRLDLEALEASGADAGLVSAAVAEADRLEATIAELLMLSDAPSAQRTCDVGELAAARLDAWRALARAAGREVALDAAPVPPVRARPAAIGQCLQVLLDNALEHGAGDIVVSVEAMAAGGGRGLTGEGPDTRWVRLCVADHGPGIPPERLAAVYSGRADVAAGRGLALARQLVEAEGGRLTFEPVPQGALVCLLLPAVERGHATTTARVPR